MHEIPNVVLRFALLELVLSFIPGVAVMLTVATSLRRGPRTGIFAVCGLLAGNAAYFVLSGAGVVALLLASYTAFTVLKYAGAAYVAYLGIRALFAKKSELPDPAALDARVPGDARRAFVTGLVTQLSNPKAMMFFVAILPQFIVPHVSYVSQIAVLMCVSIAIEFAVLCGFTIVAARVRRMPSAGKATLWFERAGGVVLIALAATIAREPMGAR